MRGKKFLPTSCNQGASCGQPYAHAGFYLSLCLDRISQHELPSIQSTRLVTPMRNRERVRILVEAARNAAESMVGRSVAECGPALAPKH
eukprot:scaffold72502_cov31-Tisochrysis_lutea.AAC.5